MGTAGPSSARPGAAFTGYGPAPVRPAGTRPPIEPEDIVESDVPARLDRLPWAPFHTLVVIALGVTWILDGLEVTLAGALSGAFKQSPILASAIPTLALLPVPIWPARCWVRCISAG